MQSIEGQINGIEAAVDETDNTVPKPPAPAQLAALNTELQTLDAEVAVAQLEERQAWDDLRTLRDAHCHAERALTEARLRQKRLEQLESSPICDRCACHMSSDFVCVII